MEDAFICYVPLDHRRYQDYGKDQFPSTGLPLVCPLIENLSECQAGPQQTGPAQQNIFDEMVPKQRLFDIRQKGLHIDRPKLRSPH